MYTTVYVKTVYVTTVYVTTVYVKTVYVTTVYVTTVYITVSYLLLTETSLYTIMGSKPAPSLSSSSIIHINCRIHYLHVRLLTFRICRCSLLSVSKLALNETGSLIPNNCIVRNVCSLTLQLRSFLRVPFKPCLILVGAIILYRNEERN